MIFAPVAIASASIFCILTRYCARNCCNNSSEEADESEDYTSCCFSCCPRIFEPQVPDEDLSIPFSRSMPYYSSFSISNSDRTTQVDELNSVEMKIESSLELVSVQQDEEVVDSRMPLIVDAADNSITLPSMSPPDLLLLKGDEALKGYSTFLKNTSKTAQGPSVVHGDYNYIKSKSFTKSFDFQEESDNENSLMDGFDADYSEKYQKFLERNNISDRPETLGSRSNSCEKKVQFYGMAEVRSFISDPNN